MKRDARQHSCESKPLPATKAQQQRTRRLVLAQDDIENALWALRHYVQMLLDDGGAEKDLAHRYFLSLRVLVPQWRHEDFGVAQMAQQYEQLYGEAHESGDLHDPPKIADWLGTMRGG